MVLANPAGVEKIEAEVIGWTGGGERLESYDRGFLKVVKAGTSPHEPASVYNSIIRPISEYLDVPQVSEWKKKMANLSG